MIDVSDPCPYPPGSPEKIEWLRERADRELPMAIDGDAGWERATEKPEHLSKEQMMSRGPFSHTAGNAAQAISPASRDGGDDFDRLLAMVGDPQAIQKLDERIADLEKQIAKLQSVRKMLGAEPRRPRAAKLNEEHEVKIVDAIKKKKTTMKAVAEHTG